MGHCLLLCLGALATTDALAAAALRSPQLHRPLGAPRTAQPALRTGATARMTALTAATAPSSGLLALRGGLSTALPTSPEGIFTAVFSALAVLCAGIVFGTRDRHEPGAEVEAKPADVKALQWRFLAVFWLFKMADWLQGPYFYEVYASKVLGGVQVSIRVAHRVKS